MWVLAHNKLPTIDALKRKGFQYLIVVVFAWKLKK